MRRGRERRALKTRENRDGWFEFEFEFDLTDWFNSSADGAVFPCRVVSCRGRSTRRWEEWERGVQLFLMSLWLLWSTEVRAGGGFRTGLFWLWEYIGAERVWSRCCGGKGDDKKQHWRNMIREGREGREGRESGGGLEYVSRNAGVANSWRY